MHIHDMALTETSYAVCGIGEFKWLSTNRIYLFYVLPSFYFKLPKYLLNNVTLAGKTFT